MTSTAAMEEAREILATVARERQTIHYEELVQIKSERIHWRGAKLGDLLGMLSEDEWRAGRGFVSAVAVPKAWGIQSDGFFRMVGSNT